MELSFIVLTWNAERYLERCLGSIGNALRHSALSYEVLILDNGSHDLTAKILSRMAAESPGRMKVYLETENAGTTRPRNRLFAASRGDYLCVMDSDVELPVGVVDALIPRLQEDSGLGIAVPRIVYPHGGWQKSVDRFPTLIDKVDRFFRLREIESREGQLIKESVPPFNVDYAISAFWLFRRDLLGTVGLLDERIFFAPEDVDFCIRVWKAGLRILYDPSVAVVHHTQEITRGWKLNKAKVQHVLGLAYCFRKHRYLFRRPRFHEGLSIGEAAAGVREA